MSPGALEASSPACHSCLPPVNRPAVSVSPTACRFGLTLLGCDTISPLLGFFYVSASFCTLDLDLFRLSESKRLCFLHLSFRKTSVFFTPETHYFDILG